MSRFLLIVSFVWCCCSCISFYIRIIICRPKCLEEYTHADVENLALLCKVWGFMKYYHPSVRAGEYDWDRELLCIMPSLVFFLKKEKRNEVLVKWIDQFDFKRRMGSIVCVRRIR